MNESHKTWNYVWKPSPHYYSSSRAALSLVYTYFGSLNVDGVCTNKLSLMFVKTSFWAKKIASLCFISSPLKAVEKAFKAKVEAGICGSQQLMCHVEAMDLRYGATSRPTRDMTGRKNKRFLSNKNCYFGWKMLQSYGLNQDLVIFTNTLVILVKEKTIFKKNCILLNMSRPNYI